MDDTTADGLSEFQTAVQKDNYKAKSINLLEKAEVPSDCTVLVVAGPTGDYIQAEVDAIKKYVENGGRALFLLDPPLKLGRKEISDNKALVDLLASWGVTPDKDLLLDENPVSQLVGLDATVPLVTTYESHPIVSELAGTATGFPDLPVARYEEHRQDLGYQAIFHIGQQFRDHQPQFAGDPYRSQ